MTALRHRSSLRRWLIGLALAALLATQWLAQLHSASGHGLAHGTGAVAAVPSAADADAQTNHAPLGLEWAHEDGSAFCKLLDHCVLAKHVASAALAAVVAAPDRLARAARAAAAPGAAPTRYLARAPPLRAPTHQG